ncbi:MAG TPA: nucleoside 2-deoxyribosyltransferase [Chitinophagaceae bacterium]|nr:nucleoside 2-deoxyribosyltransferase [Chitinophagaceae bacterium]
MKIYFAGAIRGGRDDMDIYISIVEQLRQFGEVLTEHVAYAHLTSTGEESVLDQSIFERDLQWLRESDILVAEVTTPSLGVGYEIATAEKLNKPVICLFRQSSGKKLSAMIAGNTSIKILYYNSLTEVQSVLSDYFNVASNQQFI